MASNFSHLVRPAHLTAKAQPGFFEALHDVSLLLHRSLNKESILDAIMEQLDRFVTCDAACVILPEAGCARVFRWWGYRQFDPAESFAASLNMADCPLLQTALNTGAPVLISTVTNRAMQLYGPGQAWVGSHITVPLCVQEQVLGFLKVDCRRPGSLGPADAERLRHYGALAALALHNAHLYNQARREIADQVVTLKRERNFFSAVLDMAGALVLVLSPQGRILRLNHDCEQITGYTTAAVRGKYLWDVFVTLPEDVSKTQLKLAALETGRQRANRYESCWRTQAGRQRFIAWSNTVLATPEGEVEYIISTGVDITERRQLEERLAGLHQLGRELNLLRDETAICRIVLETASFLLELKSSGFGVVSDEQPETLQYTYQPVRGVPQALQLQLPLDNAQRIAALAGGSQPADHARRLWLTATLTVRGRTIGVLDVEGHRPDQFTAADRLLVQTLADQTAVAIENARLHRETQHKVEELSALGIISQAITATLNLADILTLITDHTIRLMGAAAASVVIHDESRDDLWFHTVSGGVPDFVRGKRLSAGQGIVGWVIKAGEPALVPDVTRDPRFFDDFDRQTGFTTRSILCVPLQSGRQIIGAIEAINKRAGVFSEEDLRLLTRLATPAAIAIKNARLFEAEHRAREQAEILRDATATLTSSLELDQVLNDILVHLEKVVPFKRARLFLQNKEWLEVVAEKSDISTAGQPPVKNSYSANHALYRKVRETGNPLILPTLKDDPELTWLETSSQTQSWMGVPLMTRNKVMGLLTVASEQPAAYGPAEAALAKAFANQATVAIQNAKLFRQIRAGHKQLQFLSRRLVEAQELERHRIARELHDEAGQALTSLIVGLRVLENELGDIDRVHNHVAQLRQVANDVSENLHRMAMDLRPASLDYLGLVPALRQYIKTCRQQYAIPIEFEAINLEHKRLSETMETNIYRIVQEAVTNVARHARASRVDILLEHRQDHLITIVEDNGLGFDPELANQKERLGLLGMRERAEMLGGKLAVESRPGGGTTIHVEVPYVDTHSDR